LHGFAALVKLRSAKEGGAMARRHELSDRQWERIKDRIPGKAGDPGRTGADNRRFLQAVVYVCRTGIPWADLPERFGKPNTVWRRFDRWAKKGVWAGLFTVLGVTPPRELQLDSTTVKAHPCASGARRRAGEKRRTPQPGRRSGVPAAG
jgi:putative transposase